MAGAATILWNYFAPVGGSLGQTTSRQIDTLAGVGGAFSSALNMPVSALWTMQNGYALCTRDSLDAAQPALHFGISYLRDLFGVSAKRTRIA